MFALLTRWKFDSQIKICCRAMQTAMCEENVRAHSDKSTPALKKGFEDDLAPVYERLGDGAQIDVFKLRPHWHATRDA